MHPPADASDEGAGLVAAEVVAGNSVEDRADGREVEGNLGVETWRLGRARYLAEVSQQPRRHLLDREHVVDEARANRALRHRVVLGRAGDWASVRPPCSLMARRPLVPSVPVPERTIPTALSPRILGERAKERVHGHLWPGLFECGDAQASALEGQLGIGRYDVDVVGLD